MHHFPSHAPLFRSRPDLLIHPALTTDPNWLKVKQQPEKFIGRFGICNLPCIPMRAEPSDGAEMEGQLLFGEVFQIVESKNSGFKVERCFKSLAVRESASMRGWIDNHITPATLIDTQEADRLINHASYGVVSTTSAVFESQDRITPRLTLPLGSLLPDYQSDLSACSFRLRGTTFFAAAPDSSISLPQQPSVKLLLNLLTTLEGTQYLWGGQTSWGIDCSGLTQTIFRTFGVELPRNASAQIEYGEVVNQLDECITGDLIYFKNRGSTRSVHLGVAVVLDDGKVALYHARQRVKLQLLEEDPERLGEFILPERPDQEISGIRRLLRFN